MRRILQRANEALGTNWTLHDLRHTAASRMANGGKLTLPEVQAVLRHANIQTTSRYLAVRVEEIFDKLNEYYNTTRVERSYPTGYDADDIAAVFGA
ncbi:site-specific integrase [Streptomyces sp. NPDC005151]